MLGQLWNDATPAANERAAAPARALSRSGGGDDGESIDKLLRESIMRALIGLVHVLGEAKCDASALGETVVSLVQFALYEAAHGDDLLLESALELWDETLRASGAPSATMLNVYGELLALLARTIEPLQLASHVLVAYWRAPPPHAAAAANADDAFVDGAAGATGELLAALFGAVKDEAVVEFLYPVRRFGRARACQCSGLTPAQLADAFLQRTLRRVEAAGACVALLTRLLGLLLSADETSTAKAVYAVLWARALLAQPQWCVALLAHQQANGGSGGGGATLATATMTTSTTTTLPRGVDLLAALLDALLEAFDSVGPLRWRKLFALGLCSVASTSDERVLARLEQLLNVVIDVALQLGQALHDEFDVNGLAPGGQLWLFVGDPVNNLSPAVALAQTLSALHASAPALLAAALAAVDPLIVGQFNEAVERPPLRPGAQ